MTDTKLQTSVQLMERLAQTSEWMLQLWQPSLPELHRLYESRRHCEALFTGMVAFLGFLNGLWPLWLRSCVEAGLELTAEQQRFRLDDFKALDYPWLAYFNPTSSSTGWFLVRGPGISDSAAVLDELGKPNMLLTIQSFQEDGSSIIYGDDTRQLAYTWGILGDENRYGRSLDLPMIDCDRLSVAWPQWRASVLVLRAPLQDLARSIASERASTIGAEHKLEPCNVFLHLATILWQLMQKNGIIHCSVFKAKTLLNIFLLRKQVDAFRGLLIITGDHQRLWQYIQASPW